ncbi:MAG: tetratricopeptide repeat protein [Kiritimatiellia bacterium]
MTIHLKQAFLLTFLAACLNPALAQYGTPGGRGYATDNFEGFEEIDRDDIPQKDKSWWYRLSEDSPEEQLQYCRRLENQGRLNSARKGYEALVREWPATIEAAQAQLNLAHVLEKMKKYEKAFDEYQYALVHYSGNCPYDEIIERQFKIANLLLHDNRSMFGWLLSGTADIRERFEQIVRNAPRSPVAPEAMLKTGRIREDDDNLREAIKVYDGILNRYPESSQAATAAWLSARCRYNLSVRHNYNENRCREAIAFLDAAIKRLPNHPKKADLEKWKNELTDLLTEQNYQQALFYDTERYSKRTKINAYRRFLDEFPESGYAQAVRERLAQLEKQQPIKKGKQ